MSNHALLSLLSLALALVNTSSAFAQKKPLSELTSKDLQVRTAQYLESEGKDVKAELAEFIAIDTTKINLRKEASGEYTLEWSYFPRKGTLSSDAKKTVDGKLNNRAQLCSCRGGF
jgi:hypothetical protein